MTENNPWTDMIGSVERRVENVDPKNIYWITDVFGRYGISFRTSKAFKKINDLPKLRGILLEKRNAIGGMGELNLILSNQEEKDLFLSLCDNLISAAMDFSTDEGSITGVENRLNRWRELLKKERLRELSIEQQMGLYTELKFLNDNVIPKVGYKVAITSWVGADFDRQDFLLDDVAIEVKSHKASKGEMVKISSKYQLDSIKNKIVLVSYSLTFSETGETLLEIVEQIREQITERDPEISNVFEAKILKCNFVPELLEKSLQGFIVDSKKFYLVKEDFPRIESQKVSSLITKVNYMIELAYCSKFEIREDQIF